MTTIKTIARDLRDHAEKLDGLPKTSLFRPDPENRGGKVMRAAAARFVAMAEQLSAAQTEKLYVCLYDAGFTEMVPAVTECEPEEGEYRARTPREIVSQEVMDSRMMRRIADALDV